MDKENELWKFCSCSPQKSQQFNLIFSGSPYRRLGQGRLDNHPVRTMEWDSLPPPPPFPDYRHYSPPPSNCLCNAFYRHLSSRSATGAEINGTGPDGCLPELDMFPCCKSCVYGICAFVLRCFFFCSQTVLQMEHSLEVKFFFSSSLSSCKSCIFLNTLSPVLSTPLSYVCCVCMDRLMANFAGTCTSDNKGLLLLLLLPRAARASVCMCAVNETARLCHSLTEMQNM